MSRARKVCATSGCPNLAMVGNSLCETHEQARQQRVNAARPSPTQQGYGMSWRRIRDAYLADHPLCVECGKQGSHVDHIKPKSAGGSDDESNLQTLCHRHHSLKTALFDRGFGNAPKVKVG